MGWRVITEFYDREDNYRHYGAGDKFPRAGLDVSAARLMYLAGPDNALGKPVIREVEKPKKKADKA